MIFGFQAVPDFGAELRRLSNWGSCVFSESADRIHIKPLLHAAAVGIARATVAVGASGIGAAS